MYVTLNNDILHYYSFSHFDMCYKLLEELFTPVTFVWETVYKPLLIYMYRVFLTHRIP